MKEQDEGGHVITDYTCLASPSILTITYTLFEHTILSFHFILLQILLLHFLSWDIGSVSTLGGKIYDYIFFPIPCTGCKPQ